MYKFYLKHKERLGTFFIVVRQEGTLRIIVDRISEEKLNRIDKFSFLPEKLDLLNDKEYTESILSIKVWAFYDRAHGEFDVNHVYEAEEANLYFSAIIILISKTLYTKPLSKV